VNVTTIIQPTVEPVTVREFFLHAGIDDPEAPEDNIAYDVYVLRLQQAREYVEWFTQRTFALQTLRMSGDVFGTAGIELLRPPIVSISAVKFYDSDNALQTVDPVNYYLTDEVVPRMRFVGAFTAPTMYSRPDAARIEYVAGMSAVPASIKQAILIEAELNTEPFAPADRQARQLARDALLAPFSVLTLP
jgi:uncharacterized phiE125 gp8 family phage protein